MVQRGDVDCRNRDHQDKDEDCGTKNVGVEGDVLSKSARVTTLTQMLKSVASSAPCSSFVL